MSGAKSRRKGHDFERLFCRWVREEFGIEFGRNLKQAYCAQEGDTDPLGPYLPECKALGKDYQTRAQKRKAWQQACASAKKRGLLPLVVWKVPGQRECEFVAMVPNPETQGQDWGLQFEWRREVEPAALALIVREQM
jgi:hypothetical protein